jgi:hypothetical protein
MTSSNVFSIYRLQDKQTSYLEIAPEHLVKYFARVPNILKFEQIPIQPPSDALDRRVPKSFLMSLSNIQDQNCTIPFTDIYSRLYEIMEPLVETKILDRDSFKFNLRFKSKRWHGFLNFLSSPDFHQVAFVYTWLTNHEWNFHNVRGVISCHYRYDDSQHDRHISPGSQTVPKSHVPRGRTSQKPQNNRRSANSARGTSAVHTSLGTPRNVYLRGDTQRSVYTPRGGTRMVTQPAHGAGVESYGPTSTRNSSLSLSSTYTHASPASSYHGSAQDGVTETIPYFDLDAPPLEPGELQTLLPLGGKRKRSLDDSELKISDKDKDNIYSRSPPLRYGIEDDLEEFQEYESNEDENPLKRQRLHS